MRRFCFLATLALMSGAIFLFRPVPALAVAGSSYVQCLGVVTSEMSALMAAGSATPSVIAGTVSASLTLNLQPYVEALAGEICAQGSNVVSGLASLTAALSSDLHNQARETDAALSHKYLIGERLRSEREYGPHATVAHVCARTTEIGQAGFVLGSAQATAATSDMIANQWMQQNIPKTAALQKIASQPAENFDARSLFGTADLAGGSTLSPAQATAAQNYVLNVTNPVPYAAGSSPAASTAEGQRAAVANLRDHAVLSLARHVLNEQLALRTAQSNPQLVSWQNTLSQESGLPPLPANTAGVSLMSVLGTDVNSRFSNPAWLQELHTLSGTGVLRETALEEALEIEIEWQSLLSDQRMESLLAAIASKQVEIRRRP
ncbi:hypothetical protein ACSYAY_00950 [Leptospirillum ferriphilum]|uniref:Uncharacterized protein n=1 Tax=Leptospirillum ferriphilum TaxID=178606 RepID=A0A1V3SVD4_9BACT|nr:hypothetical protein [Leptospirillum ferriphilum]OOH72826.1 hypothetical protein BOX24_05405 [Leptospirillum ferriphilum]